MKNLNYVLIVILAAIACSTKKHDATINHGNKAEFFILPRNIRFMPAASGDVFQYCEYVHKNSDYTRKSVYIGIDTSNFRYNTDGDNIIEYYYSTTDRSFFDAIVKRTESLALSKRKFILSRIVAVSGGDTLMVDGSYQINYNGVTYESDSTITMKILEQTNIPIQIKENWIHNISYYEPFDPSKISIAPEKD